MSAGDTPPSPTAIQEQAMAAYPAQSPAELMLILTVLALSSGTTYTYLRRRQPQCMSKMIDRLLGFGG
ncbi:MAG: hypothetical protein IPL78_36430 [Chloroflexi bacterium]|nr:hypothetical protein [Chloroflexota bacterium]